MFHPSYPSGAVSPAGSCLLQLPTDDCCLPCARSEGPSGEENRKRFDAPVGAVHLITTPTPSAPSSADIAHV
ncbi:hypothetical protein NQZ68_038088 [Dissostichus eleginoides]|nr:hypothetical protein NQZ68_038088 [Dissostichus eleginoides]